jgi:hypothetical protein
MEKAFCLQIRGGVSMLSNQAAEGNRKLLPKKAEGDWSNQAEREEGHD